MGEPEQIAKKSHRGGSESPETKVKFSRDDFLKILRTYAENCDHKIIVMNIIKYPAYKKGYYKKAIKELEKNKNNVRNLSPTECFANYCYSAIMYTGKSSYTYDFNKLPAQQSGGLDKFYKRVIKKTPADQQNGPNQHPLYKIFRRVTKLHNNAHFNDLDAYNKIIEVAGAEKGSEEESKAKCEQQFKDEFDALKNMFDEIIENIEKMGEYDVDNLIKIVNGSMGKYKQHDSRGFTIARSFLDKYTGPDGDMRDYRAKRGKHIRHYGKPRSGLSSEYPNDYDELEKCVLNFMDRVTDAATRIYQKDLASKVPSYKEIVRKGLNDSECYFNLEYYKSQSTQEKQSNTILKYLREAKISMDTLESYAHEPTEQEIYNQLYWALNRLHIDYMNPVSAFYQESSTIPCNFNPAVPPLTPEKKNCFEQLGYASISCFEWYFEPIFTAVAAIYKSAYKEASSLKDTQDSRDKRTIINTLWNLDNWKEVKDKKYTYKFRPRWDNISPIHPVKFYEMKDCYVYDIGETLSTCYHAASYDPIDPKYDREHPFFEAVEKLFDAENNANPDGPCNLIRSCRNGCCGTPFFTLESKWHEKLKQKGIDMMQIDCIPIPTGEPYFILFPDKFKKIKCVGWKKRTYRR